MNGRDAPHDRPQAEEGATTAAEGTPVAVDMSIDRRARTAIAVFLAGPVIWATHFMLVYIVAEAGCTGDGPGLRLLNPPVPAVVTLVATAVAALACLGCAWWGYLRWRADRRHSGADEPGQGSSRDAELNGLLGFAGFGLSLLFFVSVLMVGLPALILSPC